MNYICNNTFTSQDGRTYSKNEKITWNDLDQLEEHEKLNFVHNKALFETEDRTPSMPVRNKCGCKIPSYQHTSLIVC